MRNGKYRLLQPVSIASLVFFRIVFGMLGFADLLGSYAYYHWWVGAFQADRFQFHYYGFAWVQCFPEPFMSIFFLLGMGLAIAVALGWYYRITAPLFACFFTYFFLLEKAHYLNHAYLFCWISWVMALLPAWRDWSLDVRREPQQRTRQIPFWCLGVLPLLMGIVYFFGGIAKLNQDWILEAMPLKLWLKAKSDLFLIGPFIAQEFMAWFMSWGGAIFDLSIVWLLLYPKTRKLGFAVAVFFHFTNHLIFNIGIFPYLSLALTALFFSPTWPRWVLAALSKRWARLRRWHRSWYQASIAVPAAPTRYWQANTHYAPFIYSAFVLLLLVHSALPLRHWAFPGDVAWTEEGHRYAWRMMLRSKQGNGYFMVQDMATGAAERVRPQDTLLPKQARKLWTHPDMILQYAHHLRDQAAKQGREVAVFAHIRVKLNDGKYQDYIVKETDLAQEEWSFWQSSTWIMDQKK